MQLLVEHLDEKNPGLTINALGLLGKAIECLDGLVS
jgi:hypothetical protein